MRLLFKMLNIAALLALLASCLAVYIDPRRYWQFSFAGYAFPVALVFIVLFLILWIFRRDAFGILNLIALVLTWSFVKSTYALGSGEKQEPAPLRILTWNVKNFDLYNWNKNEKTREQMMDLLRRENADVLCLQEFYTNNQLFPNLEFLRDSLGYAYVHFSPAVDLTKTPKYPLQKSLWKEGVLHQQWGVATFSRFPIMGRGAINFKNTLANDCIYTDIVAVGKPLRIYNVHFQSIHLGYGDYAAIDSLGRQQGVSWPRLRGIAGKMKRAFARRAAQAERVAAHLQAHRGPVVLCGDFNDLPVSYTYRVTKGDLTDAFEEKGTGFEATYVFRLPVFRIDYVFHSSGLEVWHYQTIKKTLSDHYPVAVGLRWKPD